MRAFAFFFLIEGYLKKLIDFNSIWYTVSPDKEQVISYWCRQLHFDQEPESSPKHFQIILSVKFISQKWKYQFQSFTLPEIKKYFTYLFLMIMLA